jgi:zinc transport system substrate-binding protein
MRVFLLLLLLSPALLAEPLRVITSVQPLKTFVEQIGGSQVEVTSLVRPGYNPHTYDLSPRQILAVSQADLYVRTGVPFEMAWMDRIRSANSSMQVIDARKGIELITLNVPGNGYQHEHQHEHENGHEHLGEEIDPHVWTDPLRVQQLAANILKALVQLSPSHETLFKNNYAGFVEEIDALDQDVQQLLSGVGTRKFLVFHPAWGYFANRYDLQQIAIEYQGKEPGAKAIANIINLAVKERIRVIFVQPQFDQRLAKQIADAIDGQVIAVDPLSGDYVNNMRTVAKQFSKVLHQ